MNEIKTGTVTGGGSYNTIILGFIPNAITLTNLTDKTVRYFWAPPMSNGTAIEFKQAAGSAMNPITGSGIGALNSTMGLGVVLGPNVNISGKLYYYEAIRAGDGQQVDNQFANATAQAF